LQPASLFLQTAHNSAEHGPTLLQLQHELHDLRTAQQARLSLSLSLSILVWSSGPIFLIITFNSIVITNKGINNNMVITNKGINNMVISSIGMFNTCPVWINL
jgi:hypothetical protein